MVYITADYTPKVARESAQARRSKGTAGDGDDDGLDLFRRFFRNGPGAASDSPSPRAFKQEQSGTGFIVDKNGYIITNHHVVAKVDHIRVKLHTTTPNIAPAWSARIRRRIWR